MNTPRPRLFWLDLETTGLNPLTDRILEIAVAEAEFGNPFWLLTPGVDSWVLHHDGRGLSPFIVDMHTKNGLLAECAAAHHSVEHVERELLQIIPESDTKEGKPVLAGNSVHFDLSFIRQWMPRLASRLSHRVYDVSAVKLFARSLGMPDGEKGPEPHRAREDVKASLDQASRLASWLREESRFFHDS